MLATWEDFQKLDIRVGRIISVEDFPEARNPSYKITVDFGEPLGTKRSCAQATNYGKEALTGKQVVCVVNFPPKQIATAISEVLILGVSSEEKGIALLVPDFEAIQGTRVF